MHCTVCSWVSCSATAGMQRARCVQRCRSCVCETSLLAGTPTANALATVCTGWRTSRPACPNEGRGNEQLGFVVVLADRWKHAISDGVMLSNAGAALDSAIDQCRQSSWVLPPKTRAQLCYLTARHLDLMVRCQVHPVPKCHAFLHFAHASNFLGNPWFHTALEDESQNRPLATIAARAHKAQWYRRVLLSWRQEFGDRARRKEREP